MENQLYKQQILEHDLVEIIWKILSQWKAILLVSLLTAALICGFNYKKSVQAYNAELAAQKEAEELSRLSLDERITYTLDKLPGNEQMAVNVIVSEKEWLDAQKEYVSNSILMQTDPTNQRVLKMVFDVDAENNINLPGLLNSYSIYVYEKDVIDAIKPLIDPGAENRYIEELFYSDSNITDYTEIASNSGTFEINLVLPEDVDSDGVIKAINSSYMKYSNSIQSRYPHSIFMSGAEVQHFYHKDNAEKRKTLFESINNLESRIKDAETTLSGAQRAAVETIISYKKMEEAGESISIEDNEPSAPGLSKKYAFIGLIFGMILYIGAYIIILLIKGGITSAKSVESITNLRLLGEAYYERDYQGLSKLLHSKFVDKYHYRGKDDISLQIEKAANALSSVCEHAGTDSIALLNMIKAPEAEDKEKIVETIKAKAEEKGIIAEIIDASDEFNEQNLLGKSNAVYLVGDGTTTTIIRKMKAFCRDYDIKVLGSIFAAYK